VEPQAIVSCASAPAVSEAISFARHKGVSIAMRSGGHSSAGHSSTWGVLIDVGPMRSVSVSGDVATVGAGARLGNVYEALSIIECGRPLVVGRGIGGDNAPSAPHRAALRSGGARVTLRWERRENASSAGRFGRQQR
jgi:FAD/FMN-containing dehydrogenase